MRENICTIPINDIFNEKCGCPVCRMYKLTEQQLVDFIVGDAMMVPEIRVETNKKGFCKHHFDMMLQNGSRLPNALILQTHLKFIRENMFSDESGKPNKAMLAKIRELESSCYLCDRIEKDAVHMLSSLLPHWKSEPEFKKLFAEQEFLCLKHYEQLMSIALKSRMKSAEIKEFCAVCTSLCKAYLIKLESGIDDFTALYDYRNAGKNKIADEKVIEKSFDFLCSDK